ncbi:MAG: hypothetical protein PSV40_15650 [Polaromonas sp.]|uniref:hypothetical protein n=1 Tax=Polaromonas sp. TaxID=1869339 RepID=UPI00248A1CDC|nr:hypothetical protein [Polaromonas sp.]MDI1270522.1 hypothetical protein [Polaromonas sp.]
MVTSTTFIQTISTEARVRQVDLATTKTDLDAFMAAEQQRLQDYSAHLQTAQTSVDQANRVQKEAEARLNAVRGASRRAAGRKSATEERLKALGRSLVEAGFAEDARESDIVSALKPHALAWSRCCCSRSIVECNEHTNAPHPPMASFTHFFMKLLLAEPASFFCFAGNLAHRLCDLFLTLPRQSKFL